MEYFRLLNLEKEPFSNSPDPDYFFKSRQHKECLQKLELSLRLRRGLNVVIGEVGTGKTTLCRQIIKKFSRDEEFETHLILDPHTADPNEFLKNVAGMFDREPHASDKDKDRANYKEFIKQYLYKQGVEEKRIVVLIIDEGQKIPPQILEILRELLNYETNEYKLLQIVIFAQREFEQTLTAHANFADRINLLHVLGPLGFQDTRLMIDYRLQKAGAESSLNQMLSLPALVAIFRATGGYPRKIVNLCHRIMLAMIVKNKRKAGWRLVRSCVNRPSAQAAGGWHKPVGALLVVIGVIGVIYTGFMPEKSDSIVETAKRTVYSIKNQAPPAGPPAEAPVVVVNPDPQNSPIAASVPAEIPPEPVHVAVAAEKAGEGSGDLEESPDTGEAPVIAALPESEIALVETAVGPEPVTVEPSRSQPKFLGMIRMEPQETLSWIMIKVYGEYTNKRRRAISASNPGLKDLDNIYSGQAVGFPAEAYEGLSTPDYLHWIRIGRLATVSAALDIIRQYSTRAAPLRIIPNWHRDLGLQFDVIFWTCFSTPEEAARYLATLPAEMQVKGEIIPGWETEAVFYANPCPGID